jgi:hypothetical protein
MTATLAAPPALRIVGTTECHPLMKYIRHYCVGIGVPNQAGAKSLDLCLGHCRCVSLGTAYRRSRCPDLSSSFALLV